MKSPRNIAKRTLPAERWIRRQRFKTVAGMSAMLTLTLFALGWHILDPESAWLRPQRVHVKITSVHDDGTLLVARLDDPSQTETVRLLGVTLDTASTEGLHHRLQQVMAGPAVLTFDPYHRRDRDGRLAVYLYDHTGELFNESLLHEGWARASNEPHLLRDWFFKKEGFARRRKVGLWKR